ncbi:hypothetical protein [Peptoniphilus asaccharolyticus]
MEQIITNESRKKLATPKELAEILGIEYKSALRLTKVRGFPYIQYGRTRLTILSRLDGWLEENQGLIF